jgi:hypothetical protein
MQTEPRDYNRILSVSCQRTLIQCKSRSHGSIQEATLLNNEKLSGKNIVIERIIQGVCVFPGPRLDWRSERSSRGVKSGYTHTVRG